MSFNYYAEGRLGFDRLGTNGDSSIARLLTVRSAPVEACPEHSRRGQHINFLAAQAELSENAPFPLRQAQGERGWDSRQ